MIEELLKKLREIEDEQEKLKFLETHLDEIKDEKLRAHVKELVEKIKKEKLKKEIETLAEETPEQPEENLAETLSEAFTSQASLPEPKTEIPALEETPLRTGGFSELEDIASSLPTEEKSEEESKTYVASTNLYKEEKEYDRERILSEMVVSLKERGLIRALPGEEKFEFRTKDVQMFLKDMGFTADQIRKYTSEIRNFLKYKEYKFEKGDKEKLDTVLKRYE